MLIETVAESDDSLLEKYLHGGKVDGRGRFARRSARARSGPRSFPSLGGSAFKNKGVQKLLDAVVDYLPSPARRPAR